MRAFHKIWVDQCEAARGIRERFGLDKAIGYLIGEKLLNFLKVADRDPVWAAEVPAFVAEIQAIFVPAEIRAYLDGVRRVGAAGHVLSDEAYAEMQEAGAFADGPVQWAEQILRLEQAKRLLLP